MKEVDMSEKGLPELYADQQLMSSVLITPSYANFANRAHGGFVLKHLDEAAYICVARYWGGYAVTAGLHASQFLKPVFIGNLLHIYASVDYTGRTSMDVSLNAVAEDVQTGELTHVHRSEITMVAVDMNKKPAVVPAFVPTTEREQKRHELAKLRRELNQTYQNRINQFALGKTV